MNKQSEESKGITAYKNHQAIDIPFDLIKIIDNNDKVFQYLVIPGHIYDDYGNPSTYIFQSGYWLHSSYMGIRKRQKALRENHKIITTNLNLNSREPANVHIINMIKNSNKEAGVNSANVLTKWEERKSILSGMTREEKQNFLDESAEYISNSPSCNFRNDFYVDLDLIIFNSGKTEQQAFDLLQNHNLINVEGKWNSEMIEFGLVIQHTYQCIELEFQLIRKFVRTLVSPHGQVFLGGFFELEGMLLPGDKRRFSEP